MFLTPWEPTQTPQSPFWDFGPLGVKLFQNFLKNTTEIGEVQNYKNQYEKLSKAQNEVRKHMLRQIIWSQVAQLKNTLNIILGLKLI
jgi:hypothetical protein